VRKARSAVLDQFATRQLAQADVEDRRQEQSEQCYAEHGRKHCDAVAERTSAPAPLESTSGIVPAMNATEVITMGLEFLRAASREISTQSAGRALVWGALNIEHTF
jgi:hypothetical protein